MYVQFCTYQHDYSTKLQNLWFRLLGRRWNGADIQLNTVFFPPHSLSVKLLKEPLLTCQGKRNKQNAVCESDDGKSGKS